MVSLAIFLLTLKIIGLILLVILALILFIALMILLVPIRYRAKIKYKEDFFADIKVSWLLNMISYRLVYDEDVDSEIRICGFKLADKSGENIYGEKEADAYKEDINSEANDTDEGDREEKNEGIATDKNEAVHKTGEPEESHKKERSRAEKHENAFHKKRKKRNFIERIKHRFKRIIKKKDDIETLLKDDRVISAIKKTIKSAWKLIKLTLPRKISGYAKLGFSDPYFTGKLVTYVSLFKYFYGKRFRFIPVFERQEIDVDVELKGRVTIAVVLIIAAKLWFDKDFNFLYRKILKAK